MNESSSAIAARVPGTTTRFAPAPYRARPIRFVELAQSRGWVIKTYWISVRSATPSREMVARGQELAWSVLPMPANGSDNHGVGFIIVHEANDGNYVLVDWWTGENMIRQEVFSAPKDPPIDFVSFTSSGIIACVWELAVFEFERRAWLDTMLIPHARPDVAAYLAKQLNVDV